MLLDFLLFLEAILAGVLSILIVLAFERNKKPHLSFKVGESGEIFDHDALVRPASKWLKVEIHNDNLTGLFSFIYDREPAFMCRASITFMNLDRTSVFGRIMPTRQDNTPEPKPIISADPHGKKIAIMPYVQETYDIPPGEYTTLSFVYREKRQSVCYGWNNESYLHGFKHPQWQLEKGRYIVKLVVKTGGREFTSEFMIFNDGKFDDFRLEMMPRSKT